MHRTPPYEPNPTDQRLIDEAARLVRLGYRRTSNSGRIVTRVDRPDWQKILLERANSAILLDRGRAADHYRRVYSQDNLEIPLADWIAGMRALIPSSNFDPIGFVRPDGVEDPGYRVELVPIDPNRV